MITYVVKLHHVWMAHTLQDRDLSVDSFEVRGVLNLLFFEYFDGDLFVRRVVRSLFDFTKGALSLRLADREVANLLVLFLGFRLSSIGRFRRILRCRFTLSSGYRRRYVASIFGVLISFSSRGGFRCLLVG